MRRQLVTEHGQFLSDPPLGCGKCDKDKQPVVGKRLFPIPWPTDAQSPAGKANDDGLSAT